MNRKDWTGLYKGIPDIIKEVTTEYGIKPQDIGFVEKKPHETIWDINPTKRHEMIRLNSTITCGKCQKQITGDVILDRKKLNVIDSSDFIIFGDEILCNKCIEESD